MSHTLRVRLRRSEGCLLRLLGQIGRRGYEVLGVRAVLAADRSAFDVEVLFDPILPAPPAPAQPRPAEVLPALVGKLVDVLQVELVGGGTPAAPAKGEAAKPRASKPAGEMAWEE